MSEALIGFSNGRHSTPNPLTVLDRKTMANYEQNKNIIDQP